MSRRRRHYSSSSSSSGSGSGSDSLESTTSLTSSSSSSTGNFRSDDDDSSGSEDFPARAHRSVSSVSESESDYRLPQQQQQKKKQTKKKNNNKNQKNQKEHSRSRSRSLGQRRGEKGKSSRARAGQHAKTTKNDTRKNHLHSPSQPFTSRAVPLRRAYSADGDPRRRRRKGDADAAQDGREAPKRTISMPVTGITRRVSGMWQSMSAAELQQSSLTAKPAAALEEDAPDPATFSETEELENFSRGLGGYGKNIARRHNSVFNTLRAENLRAHAAAKARAMSVRQPGHRQSIQSPGLPATVGWDHDSAEEPLSATVDRSNNAGAGSTLPQGKSAEEPVVIMESALKKRARKKGALDLFPGWKERYFVLYQNQSGQYDLKYFDDVVETSSGVVPVKEHACIALEYVESVWIPLHQPQNQKCRTFCLTYTTYGSRKYRQRHILDPSSYLTTGNEDEEDLDVNPGTTTLFLQSETSRLCHRWVIALNRALKDLKNPAPPAETTRKKSPKKIKPKINNSLKHTKNKSPKAGKKPHKSPRAREKSNLKQKPLSASPKRRSKSSSSSLAPSKETQPLDASVYLLEDFLPPDSSEVVPKTDEPRELDAAQEIADAEAEEANAKPNVAQTGQETTGAAPGEGDSDSEVTATNKSDDWDAPKLDEESLSLGLRLLRQDLVQKHVADVSAKVIAYIESEAGSIFLLNEAHALQQKRLKQKLARKSRGQSDVAEQVDKDAVHPKYVRFVKKRMLKLARAKARAQAKSMFRKRHLENSGTMQNPIVSNGKTPNDSSSSRGLPPPKADIGSLSLFQPSPDLGRVPRKPQTPHRNQLEKGHSYQPSHQTHSTRNPRLEYALYTNSPESNVIGRGHGHVTNPALQQTLPRPQSPDRRNLDISLDEEPGLRSYVYGLVSRALDSGILMEPHHAQDYARDRFRRVMRGEHWDCWFRDATHHALAEQGFCLRLPLCYGKVKVKVPPIPPSLLRETAVNNIIDTIRSAKDILVAASELNVRIPSHVDLRARIEASLQTRISDAWTPWLDQLLRSIR